MFIFYNPNTRRAIHIVTIAPPNYAEFLATQPDQHWIETNESYRPDEIEILPDLSIRRRAPLDLSYPSSLTVDVESTIAGMPEGAEISINGELQGIMDDSSVLEFTPQTEGSYRFVIECSGYIKKDFTLEAVSQH
jgi:hypothetical protein